MHRSSSRLNLRDLITKRKGGCSRYCCEQPPIFARLRREFKNQAACLRQADKRFKNSRSQGSRLREKRRARTTVSMREAAPARNELDLAAVEVEERGAGEVAIGA